VKEKMSNTIESRVKTKRVENELFKMAEHLHATSFRYRTPHIIADGDLQRCIDANVEAVKQLREAVVMGSLRATACLSDMLLNGRTAGVRKDVREAMRLVSGVDDPDCKGVLAHCHFNDGIKAGLGLATQSAAAGSKYGQYVLGLYEQQKGKTKEASDYFKLAAEQNYDEAQIALSKFKIQSDPDEALRLLNLAADQGNADAFYSIAEIYRRKSKDNPTTMAFRDAMEWCNLAADANHPYAYDTLISMQRKLERSY
jgi:TPR repeat protein